MAKKNYVPRKKPEFRNWHANFKTKLHDLKTKYGITDAQLAKVDQNNADVIADSRWLIVRRTAKGSTKVDANAFRSNCQTSLGRQRAKTLSGPGGSSTGV